MVIQLRNREGKFPISRSRIHLDVMLPRGFS
jgi:hypothetical protein